MNLWSSFSTEDKKQKLENFIKKMNEGVVVTGFGQVDIGVTTEKNYLLFKKFEDVLLNLTDNDLVLENGEITSIAGVSVIKNHVLYIDGVKNPRLNIKTDNRIDSYYAYKSFAA